MVAALPDDRAGRRGRTGRVEPQATHDDVERHRAGEKEIVRDECVDPPVLKWYAVHSQHTDLGCRRARRCLAPAAPDHRPSWIVDAGGRYDVTGCGHRTDLPACHRRTSAPIGCAVIALFTPRVTVSVCTSLISDTTVALLVPVPPVTTSEPAA